MVLAISLTGCVQGGDLPDLPPATENMYHLGAGDQVRVITYDEAQLSDTFTVGSDGNIAFPLVGNVRAAGLTPNELAAQLTHSLQAGKLISRPSVSVQVAQYRPVSILGEVDHPGQYPFEPGMTMLDAVALGGGFTYRAVTGYASDVRSGDHAASGPMEGKIYRSTVLQPGDVVTIYERYF
jgi:polysaccharide export outer membrane protein